MRFEYELGASPVTVPEGTHTLYISVTDSDREEELWTKTVLLSQLPSTLVELNLDSANPTQHAVRDDQVSNSVAVSLTYTASTRQLVYAAHHTNFPIDSIVAIGEL